MQDPDAVNEIGQVRGTRLTCLQIWKFRGGRKWRTKKECAILAVK